ncbi:MAG: enoyl-CoA hydratase/isomerase family protein [Paracoccaceae bacterium]
MPASTKPAEDGCVRYEQTGPVAEIILDRPAKHNALTPAMYRQIDACCARANEDDTVHAVIFHGAGTRAFCAGSDTKALDGYADFWAWRNRVDYIPPILNLRKPAIAAVKGWALGGGLEIALACDIRVVARSAVFSAPEVALGWTGAGGAAQHLTRMCGYGQAMKWLLTGDRFDAAEAHRIGMVEFLVDDGEELTTAFTLAEKIAAHSPVATQAVKAAIRSALDVTVAQGLKHENDLMSLCFAKVEQTKARTQDKGTT